MNHRTQTELQRACAWLNGELRISRMLVAATLLVMLGLLAIALD